MKEPTSFPFDYVASGVVFKVYSAPVTKTTSDGVECTYPSFVVKHYDGARLVPKRQKTWREVEAYIDEVIAAIRQKDPERLELTGRDRRVYLAATEALQSLGCDVDHAAREYALVLRTLAPFQLQPSQGAHFLADALSRLKGVPLSKAIEFYMRHGVTMTAEKTVPEVVKELLEELRKDGRGDYHIRDTKNRLNRFAERFSGHIHTVLERDITDWLQNLTKMVWKKVGSVHKRVENEKGELVSDRSRNNYRDSVWALFEFARRRGYLPKDLTTEAANTIRVEVLPAKNFILTPEEAQTALQILSPHLVPYAVLKLFSGMRTEEAFGLSWEELRFRSNAVIIEAHISKLGQRRVPPLLPNLAKWLKPFEGLKGRIAHDYSSPQSVHKAVAREMAKVKVILKRNIFRNSYISYRLMQPTASSIVAAEAGTSVRMIESNYKELTTEDEAHKWFSIEPTPAVLTKLQEYADFLRANR